MELIIEILEVYLDNSILTARTSQLGDIILTIRLPEYGDMFLLF